MSKKETFEKVYERCAQPLAKFISKKIGQEPQLVDDIFQETMIAAYRGWHTFENKSKYLTWLCRIALNKIADYYRRNIHEGSRIVVPLLHDFNHILESDLSPEEEMVIAEFKQQIRECIALLPPEYQSVIELRYFKYYSYAKIAEIMGGSERSVEGKLYRARQELKGILTAQLTV